MSVNINKVVSIEYVLTDNEGNELDSNKGSRPLEFLVGAGQIIKGLEDALMGMQKGESKDVKVAPEDAYGVYNDDALRVFPKEQFADIELSAGMSLFGQTEEGHTIQVTVKDFNDESVTIDYNHPLAGKELLFAVSIVDVRDASEDEINNGCVCDNESESGCCGSGCGCH